MRLHHYRHTMRYTAQFVVLMSCLIWGGLQTGSSVLALPNELHAASYAQTDKELEAQYPGLPVEVARSVRSVVATQRLDNSTTGQGSAASGVIIDGQYVLTAGHAVEQDGRVACANTSVIASGLVSNATASSDAVTGTSIRHTKTTDIALLNVKASDNFAKQPDIKISNDKLQVGDTVYFINYQPTVDGKARNPASTNPRESTAVVFTGIVIKDGAGRVTIATGYGKSFGSDATDNLVRKGASGGAIVNSRGQLVGLSVVSESLIADHTATSIKKEYQVDLPARSMYQVAYMQPVSQSLVKDLQSATVSCIAN